MTGQAAPPSTWVRYILLCLRYLTDDRTAYLVFQPVIARSFQIFPLGKFISGSVIVWGILLMCTAAVRSFAGLMVVRVLLGVVEACINPAFIVLTSQWYTRDEQPERTGWWNLGLAGGQIVGGLVSYGIGHIHYKDYNPWMWFFIIYGAISIVWGAFLVYYLPDTPMTARWLSLPDRAMAVERVRENKTGITNGLWKWYQFWECIRDPTTWFQFSIMALGSIPSGGVSSFGSIVIKSFGFSSLNTTLLGIPLGLVQLFTFITAGLITRRWKNLRLHCSWSKNNPPQRPRSEHTPPPGPFLLLTLLFPVSQIPPLLGAILLYKLPQSYKYGRLFSYYMYETHNVPFIYGMAMISGNVAGFTKKTTMTAIIFTAYCAGSVAGPQVFRENEAPRYPTAFISNFACFALIIAAIWMFQAYLMWQNRRRDKLVATEGLDPVDTDLLEGFHDRTDWEQKKTFRYVY